MGWVLVPPTLPAGATRALETQSHRPSAAMQQELVSGEGEEEVGQVPCLVLALLYSGPSSAAPSGEGPVPTQSLGPLLSVDQILLVTEKLVTCTVASS